WLGRWLSSDPIGIEGGINLFRYVSGKPLMFVDVNGNEECSFLSMFAGTCTAQKLTEQIAEEAPELKKHLAYKIHRFIKREVEPRVEGAAKLSGAAAAATIIAPTCVASGGIACAAFIPIADVGGSGLGQMISGRPEPTVGGLIHPS